MEMLQAAVILPGLAAGLLATLLVRRSGSLRLGIARAGVAMLVLTAVLSETLSFFGILKPGPITIAWGLVAVVLAARAWQDHVALALGIALEEARGEA